MSQRAVDNPEQKARENAGDQVATGFSLATGWLSGWRGIS